MLPAATNANQSKMLFQFQLHALRWNRFKNGFDAFSSSPIFWLLCSLWHNLVLMEADAPDFIWARVYVCVCVHKACCSDIEWPWLNFINIIHTWDFQVFSFGCINELTYAPLSRRLLPCVSDRERERDMVIWKQNPKPGKKNILEPEAILLHVYILPISFKQCNNTHFSVCGFSWVFLLSLLSDSKSQAVLVRSLVCRILTCECCRFSCCCCFFCFCFVLN